MRDRLLRDGFFILAVAFVVLRLFAVKPWDQSVDAYAYWATRDGDFYGGAAGVLGSYLYSPAFAQLLAPITWLPWPVFAACWTALLLLVYRLLAGRLALPLLLFIPLPFEIVSGNVHLLYAAAIVAGFRWPAAWALMLLTKITPGVGLIWFAVRREWRALAIVTAATVGIAGLSFLLDPVAWRAWVDLLAVNASGVGETPGWYLPIPLLPRLIAAALLVTWGGITDRRWTLPIAVTLALPIVWLNSLAILVALVPILERRETARTTAATGNATVAPRVAVS